MKKLYLLLSIAFINASVIAQTISVGGQCMSGTITLNPIPDIDGKPAYEGLGTVDGNANVQVNIFWMPAPDNLWVLAFDGQPYFQNSCTTIIPPGSANPSCTWEPVTGQTCTGGTALTITGSVTLPVSLTNFTATKNGREVLLQWKTSSENNNKGFEVQKSNDGINWTNIGFVNGHGYSTVENDYRFADANAFTGRNMYRLQQVDMDGKTTFSAVVSVDFQGKSFYTIAGNPGNGIYKINMVSGTEKVHLKVMDMEGKVIYRKTTASGNQVLDISNFSSGMYWLQLQKGYSFFTEKIIKL